MSQPPADPAVTIAKALLTPPRPQFQLSSLPVQFRWEFTRRNPEYLNYWPFAQQHFDQTFGRTEEDQALSELCAFRIEMLGVSGRPIDPATEFQDLDNHQLSEVWLSGAVLPLTYRGMARILVASLPKSTLSFLGLKLLEASREESDSGPPRQYLANEDIRREVDSNLDMFPDMPLVSVNIAMSERDVTKAVSSLMKEWKRKLKQPNRRNRSEKFAQYLAVWDLREGWTGGKYDRAAELTFSNVAKRLRIGLSTAAAHYRRAFQLITGGEYSPDAWFRLFCVLKLSDLVTEHVGHVSKRRPLASPVRRPVAESALGVKGLVDGLAAIQDGSGTESQIRQINDLINRGHSTDEILAELELSIGAAEGIDYLRLRISELESGAQK